MLNQQSSVRLRRGITLLLMIGFILLQILLPTACRAEVSLPNVSLPNVSLPEVSLPDVSLPNVSLPEVSLPNVNLPNVNLQENSVPSSELTNGASNGGQSVQGDIAPGSEEADKGWFDGLKNTVGNAWDTVTEQTSNVWEWTKEHKEEIGAGLTVAAGVALLFIPGGQALGAAILIGAAIGGGISALTGSNEKAIMNDISIGGIAGAASVALGALASVGVVSVLGKIVTNPAVRRLIPLISRTIASGVGGSGFSITDDLLHGRKVNIKNALVTAALAMTLSVGVHYALKALPASAITQPTAIQTEGLAVASNNVTDKTTAALEVGACFTSDTSVQTKDGYKQIKDILPEDEVYSENPQTGEKGLKKVNTIYLHETDTLTTITVGDTEIQATPTHPFWVANKGWVSAGNLIIGDKLLLSSNKTATVSTLRTALLEKSIKVYNFEVEDWHTYFVSQLGVLVHNSCSTTGGIMPDSDRGVSFFGKNVLKYYDDPLATLGGKDGVSFFMPLEDSAGIKNASDAAIASGMAPSLENAYKVGGKVYGISFPTKGMDVKLPTAADANGWPHYLEGGNTAVRGGPTGKEFYMINKTREFVTPGGNPMPKGSVLFELVDGSWSKIRGW